MGRLWLCACLCTRLGFVPVGGGVVLCADAGDTRGRMSVNGMVRMAQEGGAGLTSRPRYGQVSEVAGRQYVTVVGRAPEGTVVQVRPAEQEGLRATGTGAMVLPWRVRRALVTDFEGDGRLELLVSVRKSAWRDPVERWRLFVYERLDARWVPKWLGSELGNPLIDFAVVEREDAPRLLTLERRRGGPQVLTQYRWIGFGFRGEWTAELTGRRTRIGAAGGRAWLWGGGPGVDLLEIGAAGVAGRTSIALPYKAWNVFACGEGLAARDRQGVHVLGVIGDDHSPRCPLRSPDRH